MTHHTSAIMRRTHAARVLRLPELGWKLEGDWWINPRSGRRYDEAGAINIESLRETFQKDWRRAYDVLHPRKERALQRYANKD
jgi:hypothetical protein